ncbi:MAG: hypothetical protein LH471_02520 [Salinibacterium sp.]|nr:hypothetical protein [Salinibacterium sp.]
MVFQLLSPELSAVLSSDDLPLSELCAARLDGELFALCDGFVVVDQPDHRNQRAAAVSIGQPDRVIAEQRTAAWIWGATALPPWPHELCVGTAARVRSSGSGWANVREVVIEPSEICMIAGLQVTTPLRTIVDLARFATPFGEHEVRIVRSMIASGLTRLRDCNSAITERRNLPNKRRALERLKLCERE